MSFVTVAACASFQDCEAVAALCGSSFPEEVYSQGLSVQQWAQIEAEDLQNTPSWWRQIGLARDGGTGGRLLGVVVLTLEHEADDSRTWLNYSRRVGCVPTILSWMYDHVLDEPLLEHECLIDFIAVSPEARGRGVGAALMRWAEERGSAILAETEAAAVAAKGVDMTLWVAAENEVAVRLYLRSGYAVVRRTDGGACSCMAAAVHKWFLGHPVWVKMRKQLPAPPHLAGLKPGLQAMVAVKAAAGAAASAALAESQEAPLVEVPLDAPSPPQPPTQPIPRPAAVTASASQASTAAGARVALPAPSAPGAFCPALLPKHAAQGHLPLTPKIAAVGGRPQRQECHAVHAAPGGAGEGACNRQGWPLELSLAPASSSSEGGAFLAPPGLQAHTLPSPGFAALSRAAAAAQSSAASAASASVASVPASSAGGSDEEDERGEPLQAAGETPLRAASRPSSADGMGTFQLVSLKSNAAVLAATQA